MNHDREVSAVRAVYVWMNAGGLSAKQRDINVALSSEIGCCRRATIGGVSTDNWIAFGAYLNTLPSVITESWHIGEVAVERIAPFVWRNKK